MMSYLEKIHIIQPGQKLFLGFFADISCEKATKLPIAKLHHKSLFIWIGSFGTRFG